MPSKKIILIGDGGVGKTTFVRCLQASADDNAFDARYFATLGVEVCAIEWTHPVVHSNVVYTIWDCAGQNKFGGLRDGYYTRADAAIIMYSVDSNLSVRSITDWKRDVIRSCGNIPIYIIGNKADITPKSEASAPARRGDMVISCKNGFDKNKVFAMLAGSN